ncbi:DUF3553 domain-containing protein [Limnofasciculus baicalensis]|uniref:DUF3553 domain-containing protein n=1 Tax=Limnofasciculus baicalensis BBK-W-15 TaxID=2699891 RepID=A0AAE3GXY7_9CYAN|nr:DUF3553 domain-containing protein [Limnofasciculus baicalensis]MCP2732625.1 DUF3553 domain-containing protein [Limnofasciculus baicalensis BBK-W-15]
MMTKKWSKGERVIHATKPEWGHGEVLEAQSAQQDGKPCQRLVVKFTRAGTKTVSTAFADLRTAEESPFLAAAAREAAEEASRAVTGATNGKVREESGEDMLDTALDAALRDPIEMMTRLPDSVTDPCLSLRKRAQAAVSLYKFGESPAGLLDWAAVQTGLKDPMSKFNRHQLEDFFVRLNIVRDAHLKKLLKDVRKQEPAVINERIATASLAGQQAMRRADIGR